MFSGATSINLDSKGRLAIPTRYRDILHEGVVCTIGLYHPCITIYPLSEWLVLEKQLATLSSIIETERRIKRLILGYAVECKIDNAGRILLPASLRNYAKLDRCTMFIGQSNKFELWDEGIWNQQIAEDISILVNDSENLSNNLNNLTL